MKIIIRQDQLSERFDYEIQNNRGYPLAESIKDFKKKSELMNIVNRNFPKAIIIDQTIKKTSENFKDFKSKL